MKNMRMIKKWQKLKKQLAELQLEERELRRDITAEILGEKLEGSVTLKEEELKITATAVLSRHVDQAALESIWDDLSWEEQQCFEYKPNLVKSKYKGFESTDSKLLEVITVKPGMAQLKVAV